MEFLMGASRFELSTPSILDPATLRLKYLSPELQGRPNAKTAFG
jgi:hypothetical protein